MSVVIVGSIAFDTIHTPVAKREMALGGACIYASCAASNFVKSGIIGVVGSDFTNNFKEMLKLRGIDTKGVKYDNKGKSFFWEGRYHENMVDRDTIRTELNVFENFNPEIPDDYREMPYLFLANIDPPLQLKVIKSMKKLKFSIADTMNLWIDIKRSELEAVFKKVDCVVLNDSEIRQFTGESNYIKGARKIFELGPKYVIVKKGGDGAAIIGQDGLYFFAPAYPLENIVDPTGAGDSFAGAFIGAVAAFGGPQKSILKKALVYGNATASFTCEGFSVEALNAATRKDIEKRFSVIKNIIKI